jgi:rhamnose utilization protein RhaD (predicted bifunctional aldolase and dehydrogenase)
MGMNELIELSRRYGSNPDYVLAGGGNTSFKEEGTLFVKASGFALSTIDEKGFARMSLKKLDALWSKDYPKDRDAREEIVLKDMMDARCENESKRPSVEALLHALLNSHYVVHTHPSLVNGLTCGRNGKKVMEELFGTRALWIPLVDPGFILAKTIKSEIEKALSEKKPYPSFIFLQNHGIFVAAQTPGEIDSLYNEVFKKLKERVNSYPEKEVSPLEASIVDSLKKNLLKEAGSDYLLSAFTNRDIQKMAASKEAFSPLSVPFSPDHIVYSGLEPLWLESADDLPEAWQKYVKKWERPPKSALLKGQGAFVFEKNEKAVKSAKELLLDAVHVAVYTESFGGPLPMTEESIKFIANWEVEKYRVSLAT